MDSIVQRIAQRSLLRWSIRRDSYCFRVDSMNRDEFVTVDEREMRRCRWTVRQATCILPLVSSRISFLPSLCLFVKKVHEGKVMSLQVRFDKIQFLQFVVDRPLASTCSFQVCNTSIWTLQRCFGCTALFCRC